ncbi:MAG: hypothetical protein ACLQA5_17135 [Solirubrobacteraceae bacterium]
MKCRLGNSNSHGSSSSKPRVRQIAFDGDHPADLVDLLVAPLLRPEADRADAGTARHVDDLGM